MDPIVYTNLVWEREAEIQRRSKAPKKYDEFYLKPAATPKTSRKPRKWFFARRTQRRARYLYALIFPQIFQKWFP
jgi:hypothetical protein